MAQTDRPLKTAPTDAELLRRDVREMQFARAAVNRAAEKLAALPPDATMSTLHRVAGRLGRAVRRLETAVAWAAESAAVVAEARRQP